MQSVLFFANNPPIDGLLFLGEVDADFHELSAIGGEGERVAFGINLRQGFFGRLVVLELHDVDDVVGLDYGVDAARRRFELGLDLDAEQVKDEIELRLETPLIA